MMILNIGPPAVAHDVSAGLEGSPVAFKPKKAGRRNGCGYSNQECYVIRGESSKRGKVRVGEQSIPRQVDKNSI